VKIKTTTKLKGLDGEILTYPVSEDKTAPLTLRKVIIDALLAPNDEMDGEAKIKAFNMAKYVSSLDTVELSIDQAAWIKERVNKQWATLVYGIVNEIFEAAAGDANKKAEAA
jgi:hypothetical protein|tara:strand:- start:300 stop:635 length:336 start_codon:yes stop_codon:yes gene_type:complete